MASNRARAHENARADEGPRGGEKYEENQQDQAGTQRGSSQTGTSIPMEAIPLVPLGASDIPGDQTIRIRTSMCKLLVHPFHQKDLTCSRVHLNHVAHHISTSTLNHCAHGFDYFIVPIS